MGFSDYASQNQGQTPASDLLGGGFLEQQVLGATVQQLILAVVGGLLISAATSIHLWTRGRVTGIQSILNGLLTLQKGQTHWKLCIILGMIFASSIIYAFLNFDNMFFESQIAFQHGLPAWGFAVAGLLVGFGSKLGNGDTSGHSVCGVPRLSNRSLVATGVFFATALISANVAGLLDLESSHQQQIGQIDGETGPSPASWLPFVFIGVSAVGFLAQTAYEFVFGSTTSKAIHPLDCVLSFLVGVVLATGVVLGGMAQRHIVLGFLTISSDWNPAVLLLAIFAILPNILTFKFILKESHPKLGLTWEVPQVKKIDPFLVSGAVVFGLGWGLAGITPAASICLLPQFLIEVGVWFFIPHLIGNGIASFVAPEHKNSVMGDLKNLI